MRWPGNVVWRRGTRPCAAPRAFARNLEACRHDHDGVSSVSDRGEPPLQRRWAVETQRGRADHARDKRAGRERGTGWRRVGWTRVTRGSATAVYGAYTRAC